MYDVSRDKKKFFAIFLKNSSCEHQIEATKHVLVTVLSYLLKCFMKGVKDIIAAVKTFGTKSTFVFLFFTSLYAHDLHRHETNILR